MFSPALLPETASIFQRPHSPDMAREDCCAVRNGDARSTCAPCPTGLDALAIYDDTDSMAYPGGKAGDGVYQRLISLMPPHDVYIEPFLGGGALMRRKRPARLNIGIDLDPEVIRHWPAATHRGEQARTALYGDDSGGTARNDDTAGGIAARDDARFQFHTGDGITFLQSYPLTVHDGPTGANVRKFTVTTVTKNYTFWPWHFSLTHA